MVLSKKELLDLFGDVYDMQEQAAAITKAAAEKLVDYSNNSGISKKAIKQAYAAFKSYKKGNVSVADEDYFTILSIVEEYFSDEKDDSEDTVSA